MQIMPDGDFTQTGVQWNKVGYQSLHHRQFAVVRSGRGSITSTRRPSPSASSSRPLGCGHGAAVGAGLSARSHQ